MAKVELHVGECKKKLGMGIANLSERLAKQDLSLPRKLKYKAALVHMELARVILKKIECDQPDMSLEIPPPPPNKLSSRTAFRKKRSNRR